jgi:hypothetical protein
MRRPTLAQVELDRVQVPGAVPANRHEVEGEPPDNPLRRQTVTDLRGLPSDRRRVPLVGGEPRPHVALAARTAQDLVVGGQELHLAERGHPELDAGAAELPAGDPLLHDPSAFSELARVLVRGHVLELEPHVPDAVPERLDLPPGSGLGQAGEVHDRVALAGDALVELHHRLGHLGSPGPHPGQGPDNFVDAPQVLEPDRVGHALLGEQAPAAALGAQREVLGVRSVHGDPELEGEVPLRLRRVVGDQVGPVGVGDRRADLLQEPRPLQ